METKLQQLFPVAKPDLQPNQVYTVPDLAFPTGGVELEGGKRRPYIYFNMVSSVDGKAIAASGSAEGLGSTLDRQLMRRLRAASDAVIVGAETFRHDPFLPVVVPELAEERAQYFPNEPQPWGIVLSRDGNLPLKKKFFQVLNPALPPERRLVALGIAASSEAEATLSRYARIVRVPNRQGRPDVGWLLTYLYEKLGIRRLLCEGGPTFNYSLIARGFADELFLTFAPKLVAGQTNGIMAGQSAFSLEQMPRLELLSLYAQASELFFRYKFAG